MWDTFSRTNAVEFLRPKYPGMIKAALEATERLNIATEAHLRELYGAEAVRLEDDRDSQFRGKSNCWKMHYMIDRAHRLASDSGKQFDLIVRIRPDREIASADVDWQEIYWRSQKSRAIFVDEGYLFTVNHAWLADQFACGVPDVMDVYANVFSDLSRMVREDHVPLDMLPYFQPHSNLFYMTFYRGILGHTMPGVKFGQLLNPIALTAGQALEFARRDMEGRELDAFDRQFIDTCKAEIAARRR
jgi:hypothetical protein